jgi:hypothetical protein
MSDHDAKVAEIEAAVSAYFAHEKKPMEADLVFLATGVRAFEFERAAKILSLKYAAAYIARRANLAECQIEFPKEVSALTWPGIPWPDRRELLIAAVLDSGMPF